MFTRIFLSACYASSGISFAGCSLDASTPNTSTKITSASSSPPPPIVAIVDLGVIPQGGEFRMSQWIRNQGEMAVEIETITKNNNCLVVSLSKSNIGPGEQVLAHFTYDGTKEPHFIGSLQLEVTLSDSGGRNVGRIALPVTIVLKKGSQRI